MVRNVNGTPGAVSKMAVHVQYIVYMYIHVYT